MSIALEAALSSSVPFPFHSGQVPQPFELALTPEFIQQTRVRAQNYKPSLDLNNGSDSDWSDGPPTKAMSSLAKYWAEDFDWFEVQQKMNSDFHHYTVTIPKTSRYDAELPLHFVHERSTDENAVPLLLLHGWPSTHYEWAKVIKPLTSPENASIKSFHTVVPDLPGFGFSPSPPMPGLGPREMAVVFDKLMAILGYKRYGIATTDLGWQVGMWMVEDVGENIIGHMTDFFIPQPNSDDFDRLKRNETTSQEAQYLQSLQAYMNGHAAYASIQAQAPLTLALAMSDSPVGYAGWIWHLMHTVSDGYAYSYEEVITSTMLLWVQGTYGNLRTYKEFYKVRGLSFLCRRCDLILDLSPVSWTFLARASQQVSPNG